MDKFHLCLLWQSPAHVSCNKFSIVSFVELLYKSDGWSWLPPWVILIELFGKDLLSTWHCNPDWVANSKEQRSQSIRLFVRGYIVAQDRVSQSHNEYSYLDIPCYISGWVVPYTYSQQTKAIICSLFLSIFFAKGNKIIMYEQWMQFSFECDCKWEMFFQ